jgi:Domain of unknown function (DUF4279)
MAHLQRAVATLRISGDDLLPDEVSGLLGAGPTVSHAKGQEINLPSGRSSITKFGTWQLSAADTEPEDLDSQAAEILGQLTVDLAVWHDLGKRFDIDLFCGWFLGGSNEGVAISHQTLLALGERGIRLGLDIYGPAAGA